MSDDLDPFDREDQRHEADTIRGFAWKENGPGDVARAVYERVYTFVDENAPYVLITTAAILIASWHYGVSIPAIPRPVKIVLLGFLLAAGPGVYFGVRLARLLYSPDVEIIAEIDPPGYDEIKLRYIAPDTLEKMRVVTHNGDEKDLGFLNRVRINGRRGYEVDVYDPETNTAVASWQAGATNVELRRTRSRVKRVKTSLEKQADKSLEVMANHPEIVRQQGKLIANRLIEIAEGIENPGESGLHEELSSVIDETDPTENLLTDDPSLDDEPDEQDGESAEDIFARAKRVAAGEADANGHGGEQA